MMHSNPTFLVKAKEQKELLEQFQRRCLHFFEAFQRNKPLCFNARAYQRTHPEREQMGCVDADATLASPLVLGICDGVSQVTELGLDASKLPKELLRQCERLAMSQLLPEDAGSYTGFAQDTYCGPVPFLQKAYSATRSQGATSVLLAVMDNSTRVHGKLHPMVGVVTLGDCELLLLRRLGGPQKPLQVVLRTEMQRIGGNSQRPMQLSRLDAANAAFHESEALDAIERGSGLHCTSTYEGDLLVMGSDGVFDNLFVQEVIELCNEKLPPSKEDTFTPASPGLLSKVAQLIVQRAHQKSDLGKPLHPTPVGVGGKADDTSVVVAEVVEWTRTRREDWLRRRRGEPCWLGLPAMDGLSFCQTAVCQSDSEDDDQLKVSSASSCFLS